MAKVKLKKMISPTYPLESLRYYAGKAGFVVIEKKTKFCVAKKDEPKKELGSANSTEELKKVIDSLLR